jgi:hypothetical protein
MHAECYFKRVGGHNLSQPICPICGNPCLLNDSLANAMGPNVMIEGGPLQSSEIISGGEKSGPFHFQHCWLAIAAALGADGVRLIVHSAPLSGFQ